jgi:hypothetical protein
MKIAAILTMWASIALVVYSLYITVRYRMLKRRMAFDDPVLAALPKDEREEYARKELRKRDEKYEQQRMEDLQAMIWGTLPPMTDSSGAMFDMNDQSRKSK